MRAVVKMRFVRKVNDRGVLTLPFEVREAMDVDEGDIVEFEILRVVKKAKTPASPSAPSVPSSSKSTANPLGDLQ